MWDKCSEFQEFPTGQESENPSAKEPCTSGHLNGSSNSNNLLESTIKYKANNNQQSKYPLINKVNIWIQFPYIHI